MSVSVLYCACHSLQLWLGIDDKYSPKMMFWFPKKIVWASRGRLGAKKRKQVSYSVSLSSHHWVFQPSPVCSKPFKLFGVSLFNIDYSVSFSQSITLNRLFNLSLSWTQDRTPSLRGVLFQELPFRCLCIFVAIQNPISMSINQYIRAVGLHSMKRNSLDILLG